MQRHFHFTLGPVQAFVAQARRTRDFWAGSFLLSWLAAVAMQEVRTRGGAIVFPLPDDAFLRALNGDPGSSPPRQGNIPNRFFASVPEDFEPEAITAAVLTAWQALATTVWTNDLAAHTDTASVEVWRRQVTSYWEISWALTDDPADSAVLDRRKNWRSHLPPTEPGIKCMMMDGLQELSAATSPTMPDGARCAEFWTDLRKHGAPTLRSDLLPGEQLSAIAFIKRRFPRHFGQLRVAIAGGWTAHGWTVPTAVPSVTYLAAAPWLAGVLSHADGDLIDTFHRAALTLTGGDQPEWDSNIRCVREADGPRKWKALDGSVLFDHALENHRLWDDPAQAKRVASHLATLRQSADTDPVSPFYAVLLMDGDSLGKQMSDVTRQTPISSALAAFTAGVPMVVDQNSGFLVYSGGDDVLALLPLEFALPCAVALRRLYLDSFAAHPPAQSTLSGAIEYAHVNMPLTRVLQDAHHLLDSVAKDQTGRDAIACRVWKPGGRALQWSMPWLAALERHDIDDAPVRLQAMADDFRADDADTGFTNRFIYRMRERLELLNPAGDSPSPLTKAQAAALIAVEYLSSGINQNRSPDQRIGLDQATAFIQPLLDQCQATHRIEDSGEIERHNHWSADAALLLRFLATKGIEQ